MEKMTAWRLKDPFRLSLISIARELSERGRMVIALNRLAPPQYALEVLTERTQSKLKLIQKANVKRKKSTQKAKAVPTPTQELKTPKKAQNKRNRPVLKRKRN